jgi:hypothetical protein
MADHSYNAPPGKGPLRRIVIYDSLYQRHPRVTPFSDTFLDEAMEVVLGHHNVNKDDLTDGSLDDLVKKLAQLRKNFRKRIKNFKYDAFRMQYKISYLDAIFDWVPQLEPRPTYSDSDCDENNVGKMTTDNVDEGDIGAGNERSGWLGNSNDSYEDVSDEDKPKKTMPQKRKKLTYNPIKGNRRGRKKKPDSEFWELTDQAKRDRIKGMKTLFTPEEILYGSRQIIGVDRKGGKYARLIHDQLRLDKDFGRWASKKLEQKTPIKIKDGEALAYYVKNRQSRIRYNNMRSKCIEQNAPIWPSYYKMHQEQQRTYPDGMIVEDYLAQNSLQSMLERTVQRLLLVPGIQERIAEIKKNAKGKKVTLTFRYKWGFDGTTGGKVYREGTGSAKDNKVENILLSQMAFLELICLETGEVVTRNQFANSSSGMRPLRISFEPESVDNVHVEHERLTREAAAVTPVDIAEGVSVAFEDFPTLFDGKALAYIHGEASQVCHLCGQGPVDMSIPAKPHPITNQEGKRNGLTNLHAGPRFMEFCLHICYMFWWKNWSIRFANEDQRQEIEDRKCSAYWILYFFLGIEVDKVKKTGGTSNDGNTARAFFENPELTADLLELPRDFVCSLALLWKIIRSSHEVDLEKVKLAVERFQTSFFTHFRDLTNTDRRREGITWYYIASSVHRLSEHLVELLEACPFPPGMLSEEGSESNNKIVRFIREHLTRKMSRRQTMEDLMHRLTAMSDPVVLHYNREKTLKLRPNRPIDPELAEFLKDPAGAEEPVDGAEECIDDILQGFDGLAETPGPEDIDPGDLSHEEDVEGGAPSNGRQEDIAETDLPENDRQEDIAENDSPMNDRQEGSAGAAGDALFAASTGKGKKVGKKGKGKGKGKAPAPKKRKAKPKRTYNALAESSDTEYESDQEEGKGKKNPPKKARTFIQIND